MRRVGSDLWETTGSASQSLAALQIRSLLDENASAMRDLHASMLFTSSIAETQHFGSPRVDSGASLSTTAFSDEGTVNDANVAQLRAELQAANERTATVAEGQRRQNEIHATLLRAAHDEAVEARNEAVAEAAQLRAEVKRLSAELDACRSKLSMQRQTADAQLGLLAADCKAARGELVGRLHPTASTTAGVHLSLLRNELLRAETETGSLVASDATARATSSSPAELDTALAALRELKQWCEPQAADEMEAGGRHVGRDVILSRLSRLEATAEAASQRFQALQAEHEALQRKHNRLLRRCKAAGS